MTENINKGIKQYELQILERKRTIPPEVNIKPDRKKEDKLQKNTQKSNAEVSVKPKLQ